MSFIFSLSNIDFIFSIYLSSTKKEDYFAFCNKELQGLIYLSPISYKFLND